MLISFESEACSQHKPQVQGRYSVTMRGLNKAERDRVSSLITKGETIEAWRFAGLSLFDSDSEVRSNGMIVLLRLVGKDNRNSGPARLLIEQMLVNLRYLDYDEQKSWIWTYSLLTKTREILGNSPAGDACAALASDAYSKGRLPAGAKTICDKFLASSDPGKWRAAVTILLVASHLGKEDRTWSIKNCNRLLGRTTSDSSTVWGILYETVTGRFLPRLR